MYTMNKLSFFVAAVISLAACGGSSNGSTTADKAQNETTSEGEVTYRLTFNATWNANDFPTNFPSSPHFSPVVGATHNDQDFLWRENEPYTPGLKIVAETGGTTLYRSELTAKKTEGNVDNIFQGRLINAPGETSVEFKASKLHAYVSAISMIAPSPDWFVGIRDVNLYENNQWLEKQTFDLRLYDAGSDIGTTFNANNATGGSGIITLLTEADVAINLGVHNTSGKFVGTFTIDRIDNDTTQ